MGSGKVKRIGILFGVENSFPSALVERINSMDLGDICAEYLELGTVPLSAPQRYAVIVDRISHEVPFYRAFLKNAVLQGTVVLNNPFWCSADDKFFDYALAEKLGVSVPPTVILPHKTTPEGLSERFFRNLQYPLDWEGVFSYVGEQGYLKPIDGGGWRDVHRVQGREEFFRVYDQTGSLAMMYQREVQYSQYFRCYVVGQKRVRILPYDPQRPHPQRYLPGKPSCSPALLERMERDALTLCKALGYDLNTVEFAVEEGVPYAIDFMNPVPAADPREVGEENFRWLIDAVAELAVAKARCCDQGASLRWAECLSGQEEPLPPASTAALMKLLSKKPSKKRRKTR
jgi:hypothetical protein